MIRFLVASSLFLFSASLFAADLPPTPKPAKAVKPKSSVDRYQDCIQRMVDEGKSSDRWLKKCLEAGQPKSKGVKSGPKGQPTALSQEDVVVTIRGNLKSMQKCYNSLLETSKDINLEPNGIFVPTFDIDQAGRVFNIKFDKSTTLSDYGLLTCVKASILRWSFPKYKTKAPVSVTCMFNGKRSKTGKGRVTIANDYPVVVVPSGYTDEVIKAVIIKNAVAIRKCYDSLLKRKPASDGIMETVFHVSEDGPVSKVLFAKAGIKDKKFKSCLSKRIKTWKFPPTPSGKPETVHYPLEFKLHL